MGGFTLTFYDLDAPENAFGRKLDRFGRPLSLRSIEHHEKERAKIEKAAQYLGPWCSTCGKRGKNCKDRHACTLRVIGRSKVPAIGGGEQARRYAVAMREQVAA